MKRILTTSILVSFIFFSYVFLVFASDTYKLVIKTVDKNGNPLNGALVQVTTKYGEDDYRSTLPKQTNSSGIVVFEDIYSITPSANITVRWLSAEVAHQQTSLSNETNFFSIYCNISDLTVTALDSNSHPLKGAIVKLRWEIDIPWTLESTTNDQGIAVFSQMHYYSYQVSTYWLGKKVHEDTFDFAESTTSYLAECNVYNLTVNVTDKENRPISNADVTVTRSDNWERSSKTSEGVATFTQLAIGNYSIKASYMSSSNTTNINLTRNEQVLLKLNISVSHVFQVTVEVVWSDENPVPKTNVVIRNNNGQILKSGVTDTNGIFTTSLVEGAYTIEVSHKNLNKNANVTITRETIISFTFNASLRTYTLTVEVADDDGVPVNGALVEVDLNGYILSSSQTFGGIAIFNLKDGVYKVVATLNGEQKEKTVILDKDTRLSITFQKGISPELLMGTVVILGVISTVCFAAWHLQRRRQKRLQFGAIQRAHPIYSARSNGR